MLSQQDIFDQPWQRVPRVLNVPECLLFAIIEGYLNVYGDSNSRDLLPSSRDYLQDVRSA